MKSIKKQIVILVTTIVFAIALCGAVSAEDSQVGGLNDTTTLQSTAEQTNSNSSGGSSEDDPIIYGVIKANGTPANGAIINIRNPTNNSLITSGTTNSSGNYNISFISNLTQFNVEIVYSTYKNYIATVSPTGSPIPTAEFNFNFVPSKMLKTVKMVVLVMGSRVGVVDRVMSDVYRNNLIPEGYDFELRIYSEDSLAADSALFQNFTNELKTANIFWMVNPGTNTFTASLSPVVKQMTSSSKVYLLGGSNPLSSDIKVITLGIASNIINSNLNNENIKKGILQALKEYGAISNSTNTTVGNNDTNKVDFIYHPDTTQQFDTLDAYVAWYKSTGKYKEGGPWVGLLFHNWYYWGNDMAAYNALIYALEARGANVMVPIFSTFPVTANKFFLVNGNSTIDVLITELHSGMTENASLDIINQLNIPILNPVHVFMQDTLDGYLKNSTGLVGNELTTWIITPEINGRSQPVLIGGDVVVGTDPVTGVDIRMYTPYQPGIDQLADRAVAWGKLKHELNKDKKLALIYFDNTHDEGMPVGGSLNIEASLANILKELANEGYNVGSLNATNITAESVLALINDHGRNLVNYTQQDLANLIEKGAPTMSVAQYLQLYNTLPLKLRQEVEAVFGPAPGNLMVYNGLIVFPGIMLGNIFIGPQPIWKWNGSLDNDTLPPTHQYIAFYLWLQDGFNADAVVHTGEHGTLELLPGHTAGMTADDWPNTLIGEMPNIYIFSGANDNAKRRDYAVIISHLTPAVVETTLYGNLLEMHDLLNSFDDAYNKNDTERMSILKTQILNKINNEAGLTERLGINSITGFGTVLNKLHDYLHELQTLLTPYGLHTFGELPDNETLEKWISAIIAYDAGNRTGQHDYILNLLNQSVINEMASLLNALNGGFIKPGVEVDPVRNLNSLPAGTNTYSFDPRKVPDVAATIIGNAAVEAMLKEYLAANNNTFPETVGTSIRGGEVITTNGESIATIFYLLGVKPVYLSGTVVGTEVIPLQNMTITIGNVTVQRPRMDVLISASVSFINTCPNIMALIDNAIKQVALLNESTDKNYVRKHYLAMIPQLKTELLSKGLSQAEAEIQAERLARARIFGLPPGADPHAMGTARILRSSETWTDDELAEAYLEYESYLYGDGLYGEPGRSVMEKLLMTVETSMVITPRLTNGATAPTYRSTTMMEFMVKRLTGRDITGYVVNTGNAVVVGNTVTGITVKTLKEALYDSITMTLLNPVWRDGMLKEGRPGEARIALAIRSMYTLNINGAVDPNMWQQIANEYLFGPNALTDPDARAMIANVVNQLNMRGMMHLTSEQARRLAQIRGVKGSEQPNNPNSGSSNSVSQGHSSQSGSVGSNAGQPQLASVAAGQTSPGDQGQTAYEVSKTQASGSKDDGAPLATAVAGTILLICLIGVGYFRADLLGFLKK